MRVEEKKREQREQWEEMYPPTIYPANHPLETTVDIVVDATQGKLITHNRP